MSNKYFEKTLPIMMFIVLKLQKPREISYAELLLSESPKTKPIHSFFNTSVQVFIRSLVRACSITSDVEIWKRIE